MNNAAQAEELSSAEVIVKTPEYAPESNVNFREGQYVYEVSWQGIPAAEAILDVAQIGTQYRLTAKARSLEFIDIFYKLRYQAEGVISAVNFAPYKTVIHQSENSRVKDTLIEFSKDGEIFSKLENVGKATKTLRFRPDNFTLDPFSASFLARSLSWSPGVTREFDTFDGKSRYLVKLTCTDRIKIKINGSDRDVLVISPEVFNLNKGEKHKKLKKAEMYVTDDRYREVLALNSKVFIGTVKTELKSFSPSTTALQLASTLKNDGSNNF